MSDPREALKRTTTGFTRTDGLWVFTCSGVRVDIRELAEQALHVWPLVVSEEALGREASLILPPGLRTRRFAARLPRVSHRSVAVSGRGEWGEGRGSADAGAGRVGVGASGAAGCRHPWVAEAVEWPLVDDVTDVS